MKRLLLLITVSMLLAMWILSAWEIAQAASSTRLSNGRATASTAPSIRFRPVNLEVNQRITDGRLRPTLPQVDIEGGRLDGDRLERPALTAPILFDPIERHRLIR
jgi:hypothetical protein